MQISVSGILYAKGERVAAKIEKLWYVGTVTRATTMLLTVLFDDGEKKSFDLPSEVIKKLDADTKKIAEGLTTTQLKPMLNVAPVVDTRKVRVTAKADPEYVLRYMPKLRSIYAIPVDEKATAFYELCKGFKPKRILAVHKALRKTAPGVQYSSHKLVKDRIKFSELSLLDFCLGWVKEGYSYRNKMASKLHPGNVPVAFRQPPSKNCYRGIILPHVALSRLETQGKVRIRPRRLASWSEDKSLATIFAEGSTGKGGVALKTVGLLVEQKLSPADITINITKTILTFLSEYHHDALTLYPPEQELLVEQSADHTVIKAKDVVKVYLFTQNYMSSWNGTLSQSYKVYHEKYQK